MYINYKIPFLCCLSCLSVIILLAFRPQKQDGGIGDIRYSVLLPSQFEDENGPGWVLLDGRPIDPDWKIPQLTSFNNNRLPDARGVFIRGMNLGRARSDGDPDGDRNIGYPQSDGIKEHTHEMSPKSIVYASRHPSDKGEGGSSRYFPGQDNTATFLVHSTGSGLNKDETRPRNIALYVYIKVK